MCLATCAAEASKPSKPIGASSEISPTSNPGNSNYEIEIEIGEKCKDEHRLTAAATTIRFIEWVVVVGNQKIRNLGLRKSEI